MALLVDLAQKAKDAAHAQFALDGNTDGYRATLENSRQTLVDRAQQLGYNAEAAQALADQIFRIPSDTQWKMIAETAAARTTIDTFIRTYDGRTITLKLTTDQVVVGDRVYGGLRSDPVQRASGGPVYGPGTSTSDSIPALLSNGEYVVNAEAAARYRSMLDAINDGSTPRTPATSPHRSTPNPYSSPHRSSNPRASPFTRPSTRNQECPNKKSPASPQNELPSQPGAPEQVNQPFVLLRRSLTMMSASWELSRISGTSNFVLRFVTSSSF